MLIANELTKPERNMVIRTMEGLDKAERKVALMTLLRLNYQEEFLDLASLTAEDLDGSVEK